jgi:hypothetical protein
MEKKGVEVCDRKQSTRSRQGMKKSEKRGDQNPEEGTHRIAPKHWIQLGRMLHNNPEVLLHICFQNHRKHMNVL